MDSIQKALLLVSTSKQIYHFFLIENRLKNPNIA